MSACTIVEKHSCVSLQSDVPDRPYKPDDASTMNSRHLYRKPRSISSFVAGFKSAVTKHVNESRHTPGVPVWQSNYYEHIIRDDRSLNNIRQYIVDNPKKWDSDPENPAMRTGNP